MWYPVPEMDYQGGLDLENEPNRSPSNHSPPVRYHITTLSLPIIISPPRMSGRRFLTATTCYETSTSLASLLEGIAQTDAGRL